MIDRVYPITDYNQGYTCKEDGVKRNIIIVTNNKIQTKFIEEEVDIFYPKEIIAYNPPKDRTPYPGCRAIISNNKGISLKEGEEVTVEAIYPNKTKEKRGDNLVLINTTKGRLKVKQNKIKVI